MKLKAKWELKLNRARWLAVGLAAAALAPARLPADPAPAPAGAGGAGFDPAAAQDTRYGLMQGLDHRSFYSQGDYPEPFLVDDTGLEINEARLDWLHQASPGATGDRLTAEYEHGFGPATVELEVPCQRWQATGHTVLGVDNVDAGVRAPFYEYVSPGGWLDTTWGAAFELGIPASSVISINPEFVPKIFNDTRLGERFTLQTVCGWSTFGGGGAEGGLQTFEYGAVFGYTIPHDALPLPGIEQVIPIAELTGELPVNHALAGQNVLLADLGLRLNLGALGRVQPRPGLAVVFPLNRGGEQNTHWGLVTSLVFEF